MSPEPLGAVYTPDWLVRRIARATLRPLLRGLSERAILELRVIDPACGEGAFLLGAAELLGAALTRARGERGPAPPEARLQIASRCLLGVDIDARAIAEARGAVVRWAGGDRPPSRLRSAVERNLALGDALAAALGDPSSGGVRDLLRAGSVDGVLGNPPFVEPKRYRRALPGLDRRLRQAGFRTVGPGKVDLALPFLELGVELLRPGGRLGFLIQSRFFRAAYGEATRRWLLERGLLAEIEEYAEAQLFRGRSTYTATLILAEGSRSVRVRSFADLGSAREGWPHDERTVSFARLGAGPWCFGPPGPGELLDALARRHGRLADHRELRVGVGLQLPLRAVYQLEGARLEGELLVARNGLGEEVRLERAALRPLCRNHRFYPLRVANEDAWVIFPYAEGGARELPFTELAREHPETAAYLRAHRPLLEQRAALAEGAERWHLYRYPKNLLAQSRPKVLFPTTTLDTAAAVDEQGGVYLDNVRVVFLQGEVPLLALAAFLSSTPFSALARAGAGLSEGGWRQLNRQYLGAAPLPLEALRCEQRLATLARRIQTRQEAAVRRGALPASAARAVDRLWDEVDGVAADLYGLDRKERALLAREPRKVGRAELLRRHLGLSASACPSSSRPRREDG